MVTYITPTYFADLALGSDKTFTVPTDRLVRPTNISIEFVASATVGNRVFGVNYLTNGGTVMPWRSVTLPNITASQVVTVMYNFNVGAVATLTLLRRGMGGGAATASYVEPIPDLILNDTSTIRFYDSAAIDNAGDRMRVVMTYELIDGHWGMMDSGPNP